MKTFIAGLCIALAPVATWGQSLTVSSVIPTMALTAGSTRRGELPPLVMATRNLIAPAITGHRPAEPIAAVAATSRPQCNMLIAAVGRDSEIADSGHRGVIANRAVPIPTQRAGCINAFAPHPVADTAVVPKH